MNRLTRALGAIDRKRRAVTHVVEDVAWCYEEPLDESIAIRGHLSFDPERADVHAELPVGSVAADCGGDGAVPSS